jgi:Protein of unknown function (DUF1579)
VSDEPVQGMQLPQPDPALKRLEPYLGTWTLEGHLVGSTENNIKGRTEFRWLPGGVFLEQRFELDFMGMTIHSLELIGYEPATDTFPSTVFTNVSPSVPVGVEDRKVKISVSYGPMNSTFTGEFTKDGRSFGGGWRPNPGADETVNVANDISGSRAE